MREADLVSLLAPDDLQELKEAVCDAVIERTKRLVSGEGEHGRVILGEKPSRVLASGFLLPRLNADGDDESSDIRIAAHGMDFRVRVEGPGEIHVRPTFSVYVRALPSAEELFARNGRLIPPAEFSAPARTRLRNEIRARLDQRPPGEPRAARLAAREAASRDVMEAMGVTVPTGAHLAASDDEADGADDVPENGARPDLRTRLRIPSAVSRTYEVPQKWVRVGVDAPPLALTFPCDPDAWRAAAAAYKSVLIRAARDAAEAWIASSDGQAWAWRPRHVQSEELWDREGWERFLARARTTAPNPQQLSPPLDIQILVDPLPDVLSPGIASLRIAFENLREQDDRAESGVFNVSLAVDVSDAALVPMRLERVERSYHLAGFLSMSAVGVNGGVEVSGASSAIRTLRTTWMPRYVLPRTRAAALAAVSTAYATLADAATDVGALNELARDMRQWIADVETGTRLFWPGEAGSAEDERSQQGRFRSDVAAWQREADRIARGVELLKESQIAWRRDAEGRAAVPYRAWLLLNATFAATNPRRAGDLEQPGWRLFQLGFVLAHVPTLASRLSDYESHLDPDFDEGSASLLYMSTGGGKTEAFFGTIVYALFLDRLRGKRRGISAMMHYPLRLLTIQQAQRLARLLASAEMVRRRAGIQGAPFEIGFWVGSANTPNRTEQRAGVVAAELQSVPSWRTVPIADEERLSDPNNGDKAYIAARDAWNKLPVCPFCAGATGLRLFPERHHRLGIVCTNQTCPWGMAHAGGSGPEPLPFLLADSDIYRRAPAVLLGTVDKLALLGQSTQTINRIAGMFGMARFLEGGEDGLLHTPDHDLNTVPPTFEHVAPSWADGREVFHDPFPSLIVQDEMHLLDESLGTFGGVFETALMAWLEELAAILGTRACRVPGSTRPRLPHVVGATATAADAAKHVGALYQRKVVQFPHPGPSLHDGFYVRLDRFTTGSSADIARTAPTVSAAVHPREREMAAPWARVYASLMTNGRLHTVTTLSVLAAHAATVTRWLRDLGASDPARQERAAREIHDSISNAPWADRRRAAVSRQITAHGYGELAALVDLHRIALTYVTNKKGGDQILSAITAAVLESHEEMGPNYTLSDFRMDLISGGVDVKGIQSVIRNAEEPFDPMRDDLSGALRGIVATSAISHGVDVEAFNAMVFAGMPADIAEYIQASSRVGRRHVGFSLLVPTPQARRDRFVIGVHEVFHRLLERMLAPPAIERWADRALQRSVPSLIQTWLAGVHYQYAFAAASDQAKTTVRFPGSVDAVDAIFKGVAGDRHFDECVAFVQRAIGMDAEAYGPTSAERYYRDLVRAGVDDVRAEIASDRFTGTLRDFWSNDQNPLKRRRPMLSLRDVDEAGTIQGSGLTLKNKRLKSGQLAAAMAVLRNRGVGRGRQSAASETDGDE